MLDVSTLYLIRHGETVWNRDGNRYAGISDIPMTDEGRVQVASAARAVEHLAFDAISSSTLMRARETAEMFAEGRNVPVVSDPRLNEMHYGEWEGRTHEEIRHDAPGQWEEWAGDPAVVRAGVTGETAVEVFARMEACIREIFREGQTILVVGHHSANRIFVAGSLGMPISRYRSLSIDNLGACVLERSDWGDIWRGINQRWIPLG